MVEKVNAQLFAIKSGEQLMSRKVTFLGGGSSMRPGRDGRLEWDSSSDPAGSEKSDQTSRRWGRKEIERQSKEAELAEGKLIRSFISQCAAAHAAGKLDAAHPGPPKQLKARIKNSGGNVAWLGSQRQYQGLFHKSYCRILGREIPIAQVWAQPNQTPKKSK